MSTGLLSCLLTENHHKNNFTDFKSISSPSNFQLLNMKCIIPPEMLQLPLWMMIYMANVLRFRLQEVEEAHQDIKQMQYLTSLLPLASPPKDTSALLQYLVNEPANSGLNEMFYCVDPLADVDSARFSSFLLQVLINCSTRNRCEWQDASQSECFIRNRGKHSKIMTMLFKLLWHTVGTH